MEVPSDYFMARPEKSIHDFHPHSVSQKLVMGSHLDANCNLPGAVLENTLVVLENTLVGAQVFCPCHSLYKV